jgi:hypothetical protein
MKIKKMIYAMAILWIAYGCSQERKSPAFEKGDASTTRNQTEQTASKQEEASVEAEHEAKQSDEAKNIKDSTFYASKMNLDQQKGRKFIRTAEVKGKVKDVLKTTLQLEDITAQFKGFVTSTNLQSPVSYTETVSISADSLLEIKHYVMENHLVIRVPNEKLDSLMRKIGGLIEFLDYRVIKAEDVTLQLLANSMQQQRYNAFENRYTNAIDSKGRRLDETAGAEENLLNRQMQADQNKIQKLNIEDQIAYSTIQLIIYQRENVTREVFANYRDVSAYRPSLWKRIGDAFVNGWWALENIIVLFFEIWWFWIMLVLGWFGFKRWRNWRKSKKIS